jgi:hypothetical protein
MEMTIDKAKPKIQFVRNALNDDMEIAKAYDLAILIMGKYQKIEQILDDCDLEAWEVLGEIRKVVEDGKNT